MILALFGALAIGLSLGLLGAGGTILTVPILVFLLQRPEKMAIAESLAIVGGVALVGAIPYALRDQIHWRSVLLFGLPGMLGAFIGGGGSYYISGQVQLTLFAIVMLIVAGLMLFGPLSFDQLTPSWQPVWMIILEGFFIGCLTGVMGVGGGFLIVPSLVILCNLPMPYAIGTSLMIIAINALTGFVEQLFALHALDLHIDWKIITLISLVGLLGSLMGSLINNKISQIHLRKIFGLSVLSIGLYIILKEFY